MLTSIIHIYCVVLATEYIVNELWDNGIANLIGFYERPHPLFIPSLS